MSKPNDISDLLQYCRSVPQRQAVEQVIAARGSTVRAAEAAGRDERNLRRIIQRIRKQKELAQFGHPGRSGYSVDKISELFNKDGEQVLTWFKSSKDLEDIENFLDLAIERLADELPRIEPSPPIAPQDGDLLTSFVFGDPHMNMLSWARETGRDWDLEIAVSHHTAAFTDLFHRAPRSKRAVLATMGDMFHSDSLKAETPGSGNLVDVDGRLVKSWDAVIIMVRAFINMLLDDYEFVDYVCIPGNHSPTLERLFASTLRIAYENEPRVTVVDNADKHTPYVFGKNFLLFTHGDRLTMQKKADIAVSKYRTEHGKANFTHCLSGHLHHRDIRMCSGVLTEIFEVLPPPDAWHNEGGFCVSDQGASAITYHREGGIYQRTDTNPRIYLRKR